MTVKIRIALFVLLAIHSIRAQDHSYIKFEPPFSKDTLQIKEADTLKYDLNISYVDNSFSLRSITGKLQVYNRYNLLYYKNGFSVYNSGRMLTLSDKNRDVMDNWDIPVYGNPDIPNLLNFEYRTSPTDKYSASFSLENLRDYISNFQFRKMTFPIGDKDFFFKKDGRSTHHSLHGKYLDVLFKKEDIQDVNIFNNKSELIFKISYKFLMALK